MARASGREGVEDEMRDSRSISERKIREGSSSRREGRSTVRVTHEGLPLESLSSLSSSVMLSWDETVLSTSALTPTIASLPSLKLRCAEPFVAGRISVSALKARNCVEVRESGRTGGLCEREVWRYASSAGEKEKDGMTLGTGEGGLKKE